MIPTARDAWTDGQAYERFIGRWSRLVAVEFIRWLAVARDSAWLDFGCGTGALTQIILAEASPRRVVGCDLSPAYAAFARESTPDPRAAFETAELPHLPTTESGFDVAVSGLVLNFVPSAGEALRAMRTVVRPGGIIAGYVWDYADGMQMLRAVWDAAVALDPGATALHESVRFPLCRGTESLESAFEEAGLTDITSRAIEVDSVFNDFDDLWNPLLGGQGPAPTYIAGLSDEHRVALRDELRRRLPIQADGSIPLRAKAWAARGVVT